jgi:hypothetical protein
MEIGKGAVSLADKSFVVFEGANVGIARIMVDPVGGT